MGGGGIGIQAHRHPFVGQLPGSQAGALQPGTGFVGIDPLHQSVEVGGADHPEGCTETAGSQGAGVAVGQQGLRAALVLANQLHAQLGHGQVGLAVAQMDGDRLGLQGLQRGFAVAQALQALAHAVQGPEQIDRGRPGLGQRLEVGLQRLAPVATRGDTGAGTQYHAIGGADADGRRAAHHHLADGLGHAFCGVVGQPDFLGRQQALVEQVEYAVTPVDGLDLLGC
ncbi:hypothetical protein D3C72_1509840 [compost metagenome]